MRIDSGSALIGILSEDCSADCNEDYGGRLQINAMYDEDCNLVD
jgi:hypothetical protein